MMRIQTQQAFNTSIQKQPYHNSHHDHVLVNGDKKTMANHLSVAAQFHTLKKYIYSISYII